ncbi:hypothetical protein GOEFS_096_00520 [Gordonia effusa NBRC 100432]|uniref:Lipoprotein n=1 Tax=Gordonia effusa NBRC 100432 TaxID=1077974 RepID=H0R474_9ACTN|nr:LppX_LprAFG lipoprotein [Gordonia effusa]GAB19875.1 hypothetical protein GOEFS_096_00520 [Gordonia effusa NBRC 100432]
MAVPAVAAAAVAVAVLTGCSTADNSDSKGAPSSAPPTQDTTRSGTPPSVSTTDAKALLDQASKTTQLTDAVHLKLSVDPKVQGLPVQELDGTVVTKPSPAAKGTGSFRVKEEYKKVDFVIVGGKLYTMEAGGSWKDAGDITGGGQKSYDPSVVLDQEKGIGNVLAKFIDPKIAGTETKNGVKAIKVTGKLNASDFDAIFPTRGQGKLEGEHPATVWIAQDAPNNLVQLTITTDNGDISLTTDKWQEKVDITKPV